MGRKSVDVLLEAFSILAKGYHDLHLVLVGAYLRSERERLHELGIAGHTFRLRVSDAALPWVYRKAAVMMYASQWEGFGLPVAEAMASGCPAVVSDIGALTEVGADAVRVFDTEDQAALVELVERILTDPEEAARMQQAGIARARVFTWRRTAERTATVYEEVVGS